MKKAIFLFLFLVLCAIVQSQSTSSQPKPATTSSIAISYPNAPVIEFESPVHDFGLVKKGSLIVHKFNFKNTGKEPLILYNCKAGCSCTVAKCSKDPVKPGESGFIEVHYDSMKVGVFAKEVLIASNARNGMMSIVIKGNVAGETTGADPAPEGEKEDPYKKPGVKHNE